MSPEKIRKRPVNVTFLALIVTILTAWYAIRLLELTFFWGMLVEFKARGGPFYLAVINLVWFVSGIILLWGLGWRKSWARNATLGLTVGYVSWYWLDRLFIQYPHANWMADLVATVILLPIVLWTLWSPSFTEYIYAK